MRRDMAKLLVERPRLGNVGSRRDSLTDPTEDSPRHESIRKKWHDRRKMLNENLAPLRRFLRSRVGRQWDAVYSELREHVRADSTIQYHILQHLWEFVTRTAVLIDGVPCRGGDTDWHGGYGTPIRAGRFYVHPVSGRLLAVPNVGRKRRGEQRPPQPRELPDGRQLHQVAGVWYAVEVVPMPATELPQRDAILGDVSKCEDWSAFARTYGRHGVYGVRKQQLGKRALRKLGLR